MPKPIKKILDTTPKSTGQQVMARHAATAALTDKRPAADASPETWATYVNTARGRAAAAVVEWGRRIALAHDAYRAQGQQWGRTWEDWCQENLGIGERHANRLRMIGENLGLTKSDILPAATDQLTTLARLRQQHPQAFDAAIANGAITPQLTRTEAQALLKAAQSSDPALPTAPALPPPFRRVAGLTLESDQADKLEAIAAAKGVTPHQLVTDVTQQWLKRQRIPDWAVIIDTTASSD